MEDNMIVTVDIINSLDKNNNIIVTKLRKTYKNNIVCKEEYLNDKDELHRDEDKPASIDYVSLSCFSKKIWYQNGKIHRDEDKPAIIAYFKNRNIESVAWYQNDKLHRDGDKPAYKTYFDLVGEIISSEIWYKNGNIHRDGDKPAYTSHLNGCVTNVWYQNNNIHRDGDRPAFIENNVIGLPISKKWYQNNKLHRLVENGPAKIIYKKNKIFSQYYYLDDKLIYSTETLIKEIRELSGEDIKKILDILKIIKK